MGCSTLQLAGLTKTIALTPSRAVSSHHLPDVWAALWAVQPSPGAFGAGHYGLFPPAKIWTPHSVLLRHCCVTGTPSLWYICGECKL